MENPERTVFRRPIVPQNQIAFIGIAFFPSNRCNGVVWRSIGFRIDSNSCIAVTAPLFKNRIAGIRQFFPIDGTQPNN